MKFISIFSALAASFSVASAATYIIAVGENNGLTYDPPQITNATVGDVIAFQFKAKNHSVTQSTFAAPCTPSGVDSGFFPVNASANVVPQWSFTVNNASAPLWFYCAQTGHCAKGMVFALNPTETKTFQQFQAQANMTGGTATNTSTSGSSASPSASVVPSTAAGAASGALSKLSFSNAAGVLSVVGMVTLIAL